MSLTGEGERDVQDQDWLYRTVGNRLWPGGQRLGGPARYARSQPEGVVDLSDLIAPLPLTVDSISEVLSAATEAWEQSNPTLGFTTVVKNDHGLNQDGKYYMYYAHHDPGSGIGAAVADSIDGTYTRISPPDSTEC